VVLAMTQISEYKALRCFYLAHMHLASTAHREAHGLFLRTVDRAAEAAALQEDLPRPDPATLQALSTVTSRAKTYAVVARAELSAAFEREKAAVAGQVRGGLGQRGVCPFTPLASGYRCCGCSITHMGTNWAFGRRAKCCPLCQHLGGQVC
jgi:hypothetical protein